MPLLPDSKNTQKTLSIRVVFQRLIFTVFFVALYSAGTNLISANLLKCIPQKFEVQKL